MRFLDIVAAVSGICAFGLALYEAILKTEFIPAGICLGVFVVCSAALVLTEWFLRMREGEQSPSKGFLSIIAYMHGLPILFLLPAPIFGGLLWWMAPLNLQDSSTCVFAGTCALIILGSCIGFLSLMFKLKRHFADGGV
jgi:hypothetical protein